MSHVVNFLGVLATLNVVGTFTDYFHDQAQKTNICGGRQKLWQLENPENISIVMRYTNWSTTSTRHKS